MLRLLGSTEIDGVFNHVLSTLVWLLRRRTSRVSKSWWCLVKIPIPCFSALDLGCQPAKAYVEKLGGTLHIESMQGK